MLLADFALGWIEAWMRGLRGELEGAVLAAVTDPMSWRPYSGVNRGHLARLLRRRVEKISQGGAKPFGRRLERREGSAPRERDAYAHAHMHAGDEASTRFNRQSNQTTL